MRHVGSDPQAERGKGEVNLSPMRGLTLRPRVGGFYVSGRFWEAQFVVFYVSGRLWEVQFVVFYVFGSSTSSSWRILKALGGFSEVAKSRFIGPVGVWEAHNSRSVVPVGVWRLPGMLRSHDLLCLSVFGGLRGGHETFRTTFDGPNRWGFGARPSSFFRSLDL